MSFSLKKLFLSTLSRHCYSTSKEWSRIIFHFTAALFIWCVFNCTTWMKKELDWGDQCRYNKTRSWKDLQYIWLCSSWNPSSNSCSWYFGYCLISICSREWRIFITSSYEIRIGYDPPAGTPDNDFECDFMDVNKNDKYRTIGKEFVYRYASNYGENEMLHPLFAIDFVKRKYALYLKNPLKHKKKSSW